MLKLCAYYEGDVAEADRDRFDDYVKNTHMPLVARYPGLQSLRYHKGVAWNGAAPSITTPSSLALQTVRISIWRWRQTSAKARAKMSENSCRCFAARCATFFMRAPKFRCGRNVCAWLSRSEAGGP